LETQPQNPETLLAEYDRLKGTPDMREWLHGLGKEQTRELAQELGKRMLEKVNEDERRRLAGK
jgi:hypothetical protein